jgi:hypothetical protein
MLAFERFVTKIDIAFFGSSARGTCRQRRHLGRRGRRDMAGREARRSTDRPTRAGSPSARRKRAFRRE